MWVDSPGEGIQYRCLTFNKIAHGTSNRWLIFSCALFLEALLEGRNPRVTRERLLEPEWVGEFSGILHVLPLNVTLGTEGSLLISKYGKKGALSLFFHTQTGKYIYGGKGHLVTSLSAWVLFGRWRGQWALGC